MKTKIYGIYGKRSAEISIRVGKAMLPLEFTKGSLDIKSYRPATYSTSNETIQNIIEDSAYFGNTIKLVKEFSIGGEETPIASQAVVEDTVKLDATYYDEVTSLDEVRKVLKSHGAKATQLTDEEKMRKFAMTHNIIFPNFSF